MNNTQLSATIVVVFSCLLNPLLGDEYDWEEVHYDGTKWDCVGLRDLAFGGGVYVAVGDTNFASLNGTNWTQVGSYLPMLRRVIYADGKFVAVGGAYTCFSGGGRSIIAISTNGFDWETVLDRKIESGTNRLFLTDVVFAQGKFFAVGNGTGKMLLTSTDAANWTEVTTDVLPYCVSIVYGQGRFVCVGMGVMTSTNGLDWVLTASTDQNQLFNLFGVCYGGGLFTMCGGGSFYGIWESLDGSNWELKGQATGNSQLLNIAYGAGHRITVGSSAMCARSLSGTWNPVARPGSWRTWGIHYANGFFYAVGHGNGIMRAAVSSQSTLEVLPASPSFGFRIHTQPYCDYQIDYSDDLVNWNCLTNFTSTTSNCVVTAPVVPQIPQRFYRAVIK